MKPNECPKKFGKVAEELRAEEPKRGRARGQRGVKTPKTRLSEVEPDRSQTRDRVELLEDERG
jgi:hypothetical protein